MPTPALGAAGPGPSARGPEGRVRGTERPACRRGRRDRAFEHPARRARSPRPAYPVTTGPPMAGSWPEWRGLASLGVNVVLVRIAFVALTFASGAGVMMYAAFWLFVPQAPAPAAPNAAASPAVAGRGRDVGQLIALVALTVGALLLARVLGFGIGGTLFWPLAIAGLGVVLLWREADELQRRRWRRAATSDSPSGWLRFAAGVALVLAGGAHSSRSAVSCRTPAGCCSRRSLS